MKRNSARLSKRMSSFLDQQRLCCKDSTIKTSKTALCRFNAFLCEKFAKKLYKKHIAMITPTVLEQFLQSLRKNNLAPYTMVNYVLVIKKYLTWEIDQGTIKLAVIDRFDRSLLPKIPDYLPRPLSRETDILLTNRLRNSSSEYAPVFRLLRLTGLRISELINLPRECIITSTKSDAWLKVPLGKMNNERLVPLSLEAVKLIATIKNTPLTKRRNNHDRLIGFSGSVASVYQRLCGQFKKFTRDLIDQNKPVTFHRLRHTYATTLLTGGVSIVSIMKLLGHRRIEMSLRYAQVTPTHLRDEYLKALNALENQWLPKNERQLQNNPDTTHPTKLIDALASIIKKNDSILSFKQRNFLRRLARLKRDLIAAAKPHPST